MSNPFLIIGGYGTVGSHLIELINQFYPELQIVIAGRNEDKAQAAAALFNNTTGISINTQRDDLGFDPKQQFSGIAVLTNDLSIKPAEYAIANGIPYTSIATQLTHMAPKLTAFLHNISNSKVLIQDTSFAGVLILVGLHCAQYFRETESICVGVLMDENDLGGPASQADANDFAQKEAGLILDNNQWIVPRNGKEIREYSLKDGFKFNGTSFPGFDASELANYTGASSVRVDFALGQSSGSRQGHKPSVEMIYEIEGILKNGKKGMLKFEFTHPKGQAFLTAIGVAAGIQSILKNTEQSGLFLPSQIISIKLILSYLAQTGAVIEQNFS